MIKVLSRLLKYFRVLYVFTTDIFLLDTISIDGAIRVISDEFSNALLNPEQQAYIDKAEKYSFMVSFYRVKTYI